MLVITNVSVEKTTKCEDLWSKFRELIRLITKNSDDYDETYMKIKFSSDHELSINKTMEIPSMIIVIWVALHENNKYCQQVFSDECLYKL